MSADSVESQHILKKNYWESQDRQGFLTCVATKLSEKKIVIQKQGDGSSMTIHYFSEKSSQYTDNKENETAMYDDPS